jgi:hypothetical protein
MSDEIQRFFETYAERYMASDVDAVAAMYEAPFSPFGKTVRFTCSIARPSASIWRD